MRDMVHHVWTLYISLNIKKVTVIRSNRLWEQSVIICWYDISCMIIHLLNCQVRSLISSCHPMEKWKLYALPLVSYIKPFFALGFLYFFNRQFSFTRNAWNATLNKSYHIRQILSDPDCLRSTVFLQLSINLTMASRHTKQIIGCCNAAVRLIRCPLFL